MSIPFDAELHVPVSNEFSHWLARQTRDPDLGVYYHKIAQTFVVFAWVPHRNAAHREMDELTTMDPSQGDRFDRDWAQHALNVVLSRRTPQCVEARDHLRRQESKRRAAMNEHLDDTRRTNERKAWERRTMHNQVHRDRPDLIAIG